MSWYREHYSMLDPELEQICNQHGKPKPFLPTTKSINLFRQRWSAGTQRFTNSPVMQRALDTNDVPAWSERDIKIPVRDYSEIDARVYCSKSLPKVGAPVFVVFHGGGWCLGGLDTEEFQCRLWCKRLGVLVVNVAYRLAPEHPFPTPGEDAYDSVKWVAANAQLLGGNLHKGFVVCGFSGGGTFAAIASHLARDDGLNPPITGVFLGVPIFTDQVEDHTGKMALIRQLSRSTEEQKNAPLQCQAMTDRFAELCKAKTNSVMTCPFLFDSHEDLPPVYIQACGLDPFRDSAFIYEELLKSAGSKTKLDIYPGLPHSFWTVYPQLKATRKWVQDTLAGAAWLLGRDHEPRPRL